MIVFKTKSQQSRYPKVSIFDMVSIKSLNLDSFKNQVLTYKKFLTVSKCLNRFDTLKSQFWVLILKVSKTKSWLVKNSWHIISKHMSSLRDLSLGVSICLNMVFVESLNTYSFKSQVSTVEKLLTVTKSGLDSQETLDSFKTQV